MVGTDDAARAAAGRTIEQARGAVPADVMKSADLAVAAAQGEQGLPEDVERLVITGVRDFRDMADDLPGGPENPLALEREEFGVPVGPRRQAEIVGRELTQCSALIR